jgi:hypothetical protein
VSQSYPKDFAVALVTDGVIVSIPYRRLTFPQAEIFSKVHNRLDPAHPAVIVTHPISRAILRTNSKSRSA